VIKISAVDYINTIPFVYGIKNSGHLHDYELALDIPSVCAEKLLSDKVDIGLIPIAAIPKLGKAELLTDYCIGASGDVGSVVMVSNAPLNEIETVYLDYQSETSIVLAQIIAYKFWEINPIWANGNIGFEDNISGTTAAVIIGDRALKIKDKYTYCYDLAGEWNKFTSLPFVFACWVANKDLPRDFISSFEQAIEWGIVNKEESLKEIVNDIDARDYINNYISYEFDQPKKKAMNLFFEYSQNLFGEENIISLDG